MAQDGVENSNKDQIIQEDDPNDSLVRTDLDLSEKEIRERD